MFVSFRRSSSTGWSFSLDAFEEDVLLLDDEDEPMIRLRVGSLLIISFQPIKLSALFRTMNGAYVDQTLD